MKAYVAVATVSGRAYYLIVNALQKRNVQFISLTPKEPIPIEIRAVITTENEKHLINHETVIIYRDGADPETVVNETLQAVQGKEHYERIVIGVDPGDVFGLAVLADGKIIETGNCFGMKETLDGIKNILRNLQNLRVASIVVKIGDGVPKRKEELLSIFDKTLPPNIMLESVSEAGTNRHLSGAKHRRGLRDIASAIRIAGRNGQVFQRRGRDESNS
jgi:hypothetical protein